MEEWKLFKKLKRCSLYVSSLGRVKSINNKGDIKTLSLYKRGGKNGQYLSFGYKENKKKVLVQAHQAVGSLFLESKPEGDYQLDHIDDDTFNNKADNLQWLTVTENAIKGNLKLWNTIKNCGVVQQ